MTTDHDAAAFVRWLHRHGFFIARNDQDHIGGAHYPHEVASVEAVLAAFRAGTLTEAALVTIEPGPGREPTGGMGSHRWTDPEAV